ncbi:uncharacterized protein [Haliotis asinina]|uniref:uncharacterized protein n=1 Tax=Haliotis asinina TaxID=109174 RepID=UPI0035318B59
MDKLRPPSPLLLTGNLAENWRKFKQRFELFLTASDKDGKGDKVKSSIFLSTIGEDALELYNTFHFESETDAMRLKSILDKFEAYCIPKRNITFERHRFFTCSQREGEKIDQYVTELKSRAKTCEFGDLHDSLIRDRIICGIASDALRERLLREDDLTLDKTITMCRAAEASKVQVKELHPLDPQPVHSVEQQSKSGRRKSNRKKSQSSGSRSIEQSDTCGYCGFTHAPRKCPASGKSCDKCGKQNHFARVCRSKNQSSKSKVHFVENTQDELFVDSVDADVVSGKDWIVSLQVNNTFLPLKLDTGAQANILSEKDFNRLLDKPKLRPSKTKLTGYSHVDIPVMGQFTAKVCHKNIQLDLIFVVISHTPEDVQSILGLKACDQLNLVRRVLSVDAELPLNGGVVFQKYADVFKGLGNLPGVHHIKLDNDVPPVVNACRRVPFALHDRLKEELNRMEKLDVITKVNEPTDWVSPLVIVEKPNKQLRVCIDPKDLNKAIKREHFKLPTRDEITAKFSNARYFSKLDASAGFWQLRLDEESSKEQSWLSLKQAVSQEPVLKFFDPGRKIKISSDASQNGLGAVLLQKYDSDWLPVAYASRALTCAETRPNQPLIAREDAIKELRPKLRTTTPGLLTCIMVLPQTWRMHNTSMVLEEFRTKLSGTDSVKPEFHQGGQFSSLY